MYFQKIVGHDDLKSRIRKALREDQLAHAYIFEGVQGVGKSMTAEAWQLHFFVKTPLMKPVANAQLVRKWPHQTIQIMKLPIRMVPV